MLDRKMSSIWEGTWVLLGLRRIPSLLMASHHYWKQASASKGPAVVFLSLPDVLLLDWYNIVARQYARRKNLVHN